MSTGEIKGERKKEGRAKCGSGGGMDTFLPPVQAAVKKKNPFLRRRLYHYTLIICTALQPREDDE